MKKKRNSDKERIIDVYSKAESLDWWTRFYINHRLSKGFLRAIQITEEFIPNQGFIMDVGCGIGIFDNYLLLKSNKRQVIAIDIDSKRIKVAKKTVNGRKNIKFYVEDIAELKVKQCDCVILYDVLHHINHKTQIKILKECYKKLKKNGLLIIKDVDKRFSWKYFTVRTIDTITNIMGITEGILCFKSRKELNNMLTNIGFKVKVIRPKINHYVPHLIIRCVKNHPS